MMPPVIEVHNLSVSYGGHEVLNDLNFSIKPGDIVAVLGPNASGKTTLIRAVLGLIPYRGSVLINQKPVKEMLQKIGYVPQRFAFDRSFPITVSEFLRLGVRVDSQRKLRHVLLEVDMKDYENVQVGALSGGQLQRLLIARALLTDPEILFLDEATSEIDIAGAKSFYEIVSHLNHIHKTTVILVSHEVSMVYKFADQIICLNRELICMGKPKEAITKEVLEKLYGQNIQFQPHKH